MGARPSTFRKAGGFLNGVDGVIAGYEFTTEPPFETKKKPGKGETFTPLYAILSAQVDGADEPVTTTLYAGSADDFEIEADGHTLTPVREGVELRASAAWCIFIGSLVEAGFPESNLPEDAFNFEAIIGTRVRFVQRTDEEATKRLGKRKGKDGKEYARQNLVVDQVYDLPTAKGGKANGAASQPKGRPGRPAKDEDEDLDDLTARTLREILEDADGPILKDKLSMAFLRKLNKHKQREDARKRVFQDDFLATEDGWSYDKKKGIVALEA